MSTVPSVAICFPSGDMVHADFAMSLAGLCSESRHVHTTLINTKSSIVAEARNRGVELAREFHATHLLFLDSDMTFPRTTLQRLLAHDVEIVGATYPRRVPPYAVLGAAEEPAVSAADGTLMRMRHLPTGCLMIRMSVFDQISRPHFRFLFDETTGVIIGEDYNFCDRAQEAGFAIWCDTALSFELGHIGQQVFRLQTGAAAEA